MKYTSRMTSLVFLLLGLSYTLCVGQSIIAADGGEGGNDKIRIEWTLGEFAIATLSTPTGLLTQGFHQPSLRITAVPPTLRNTSASAQNELKISLAPNPVQQLLHVQIQSEENTDLHLRLLDTNGRVILQRKTARPGNLELDFTPYPNGLYFLQFHPKDGSTIETYKITKQ